MSTLAKRILVAGIKWQLENDFKEFVRYFFKHIKGAPFVFNDHHDQICDKLMDIYYGRTTFLIINVPPRYSKTELCVILFHAWCFMKNPRCQSIHLSYSDQLVSDNSQKVKDIITSKEFQSFWPHVRITPNKDSKKAWDIVNGGTFYATPAGGQVTGFGAGRMDEMETGEFKFSGCISIDDPLNPDDAHSDKEREKVNRRWDEQIKNRRNFSTTPVIVTMQRVHLKDFCGMLLQDSEFDWDQLILKALINEGTDDERALWPFKHNVERLRAMKKKNSWQFTTQFQQTPVALGGNVIKIADFKRYKTLPQFEYRFMFADTAMKTGETHDYSVFEVWGYYEGNIYLIDVLRGKWEAHELKRKAISFWNKHVSLKVFGTLRYLKIEDKASGTGLIQDLRAKHGIPVEGILRKGLRLQRPTRILDAVPYVESGHVWLPYEADWLSDFEAEVEAVTLDDNHDHDDQIDPMCDAIYDMLNVEEPLGMMDIL